MAVSIRWVEVRRFSVAPTERRAASRVESRKVQEHGDSFGYSRELFIGANVCSGAVAGERDRVFTFLRRRKKLEESR